LKLGECGNNYLKKDEQLTELVLMNLRTPFDVFVSNFHTNWKEWKEDDKDYTCESFYGLLITSQHRLLDDGGIGGKHPNHLLKVKGKLNHKERGWFDNIIQGTRYFNQKPKGKTNSPH